MTRCPPPILTLGVRRILEVPAINVRNGVYRLPDSMSYDKGVFVEPLACLVRGQEHTGWLPGRRVLVIGSGIAGLLHIQLAKAAGAARVIAADINASRLEAANKLGADVALSPGEDFIDHLKECNDGRLAELVIVSTGAVSAAARHSTQ